MMKTPLWTLAAVWAALLSTPASADQTVLARAGISQLPAATDERRQPMTIEPDYRGWAVSFENDLLAGGSRDKDYTYGLNVTYTGPEVESLTFSPRPLHARLDSLVGLGASVASGRRPYLERHSLEVGVYGFTPDDIESTHPIRDDRPYASLVYAASYRERVDLERNVSWHTGLSVGVLGLRLVGSAQNTVHDWLGNTQAQGWHNQISDGGEPTAKYSVARQKLHSLDSSNIEVKTSVQGSVGYLTEASYALSFRAGDIHSGWWNFDPELSSYGEKSNPTAPGFAIAEQYVWGGIAIKARAYNAFLQGQFRHSEVSLDADQIKHGLVEAWLGYSVSFANGIRASYVLRGHTSEIRSGQGDRDLIWGGLIVSKSF